MAIGIGLAAMPGVVIADQSLMETVRAYHLPVLVALMRQATWLGYGGLDVGILVMVAVYGWWSADAELRERGIAGALTVVGAGLLDQVVKNVVCRARPSAPHAGAFFSTFPCFPASYANASFPSGHATTAFATAMVLSLWYPRHAGAFMGLALLVGLSRVVLGAHFPSDVLAGALLGIGVALAVHSSVPRMRRKQAASHARSG